MDWKQEQEIKVFENLFSLTEDMELVKKCRQILKDWLDQMEALSDSLIDLEDTASENDRLEERFDDLEDQVARLEEDVEDLTEERDILEDEVKELRKENTELREDMGR